MRAHPIVVVAPDSFKGSISAIAASAAIGEGLRRIWRDADIRLCPMADGGEGTLDAVLSRGGRRLTASVSGASGTTVDAAYGIADSDETAIIESAQIVGLTDLAGTAMAVEHRTTRGIGELMSKLLDAGQRRFMIGLGGSSTNDGGAGMLAALGMKLLDATGRAVAPTPKGLGSISTIDVGQLDPRLSETTITIMSDVDNVLTGPRGATVVFGPQKGVRAEHVAEVDASLARFAALAESTVGRTVHTRPGAGAAGGLGFALQLLGGTMRSGAEVVADLIGLDGALRDADWCITGEGHSDAQTLLGKTPLVVARRAASRGVCATLISGGVDRAALSELSRHFAGGFSLTFGPVALEDALAQAADLLTDRAAQLALLFDAARTARDAR